MSTLLLTLLLLTIPSREPGPPRDSCADELNRLHTLRVNDRSYILYGDPDLAAYLNAALRTSRVRSVVPVYSDERIALNRDGIAVVSTGLVLEAASEEELRAALPSVRASLFGFHRLGFGEVPLLPSCSQRVPTSSFVEQKLRLAREISRYKEWTTPRLRRRALEAATAQTP